VLLDGQVVARKDAHIDIVVFAPADTSEGIDGEAARDPPRLREAREN